jgi:hypothetical protein
MKTGTDFQQAAKDRNISRWCIHNCSMCDYPCGYIFCENHNLVAYDNGCDCTKRYFHRPTTWDHVAEQYNKQTHPEVINEMNEYWGFKDVD